MMITLQHVQERSGLKYEVTGKIGIRRKFQQNHLPQVHFVCGFVLLGVAGCYMALQGIVLAT